MIFYSRHSGGLTLYFNGRPKTVSSSHRNFSLILEALAREDYDRVNKLIDVVASINALGVSKKFEGRRVFVENGKVCYTDQNQSTRALAGPLVDRILDDLMKPSAERYADALLEFCDNLMKNQHKDIREELWEFLKSGKTPITMDGCFLAYKKVHAKNGKGEYLDIYTGKMDNAPGKIVRMNPEDVDKNRHNTCSRGLHFCSRGYLGSYGSAHNSAIVVVKINPKDVFAIPTDYSCQKGRASEYYVVGEIKSGWDKDSDVFADSFIDEDTKIQAAPLVDFKVPLKASLATVAQSYGLLSSDGRVQVVELGGSYIPVRVKDKKVVDIIGTPFSADCEVKLMSIETKSVRQAVKEAIKKAQGS